MKIILLLMLLSTLCFSQETKTWSLEQCISYAIEHNLVLKQTKLNSEEFKLNLQNQQSNLLPSINAGATHGYNWGQSIDPFTNDFATDRVRNNNLSLSGNWTLFNGLQTHYGIRKAAHELNAQEYNQQIKQRDIKIDVSAAYLQVILNYYQSEIQKSAIIKTNAVYQERKKLLDYQQITTYELLEVESQLAVDSSQLIQSKNRLKLAEFQLRQIMNYQDDQPLAFQFNPVKQIGNTQQTIRDSTFLENQYFFEQEEAIRYGKKAVLSDLAPKLSISSSLGSGYSGNSKDLINGELVVRPFNTQIENNFYQSATLNLQIPIFNKNQVRQQVKRIELSRQKLELEKSQTINQVQQKITQLQLEIASLEQLVIAQEKALELNTNLLELAEKKLNLGIITFTQFLESRVKLSRAENELVSSQLQLQLKYRILELY